MNHIMVSLGVRSKTIGNILRHSRRNCIKNNDMRTLYKTTKSMKGSYGNNHDIAVKVITLSKTKGKEMTDGENILKQS